MSAGETSMRCPSIAATPQHISVEGAAERISRLIKKSVQGAVRRFGYQLTRFPAPESYDAQIGRYLRHIGANIVLDVGAHEGEYYSQLRRSGYAGRIVSFEPVPASFERLRTVAGNDPLWKGYPLALGSAAGRLNINVPDSTGFASFLRPANFMERRFPWARWSGSSIEVPVERLDHIFDELVTGLEQLRAFLKVDTQGWDGAVIEGAGKRLAEVVAIQSEVSVIPIYEGMRSVVDSLVAYRDLGFRLVNMFPVTYDHDEVSVIEFDCIMERVGNGMAS
jgi:FkbM family methyltransferase